MLTRGFFFLIWGERCTLFPQSSLNPHTIRKLKKEGYKNAIYCSLLWTRTFHQVETTTDQEAFEAARDLAEYAGFNPDNAYLIKDDTILFPEGYDELMKALILSTGKGFFVVALPRTR